MTVLAFVYLGTVLALTSMFVAGGGTAKGWFALCTALAMVVSGSALAVGVVA